MAETETQTGGPAPENYQERDDCEDNPDETTEFTADTDEYKNDGKEVGTKGTKDPGDEQPALQMGTGKETNATEKLVGLSGLKPRYNARARSTMKNVLVEYGLDEADEDNPKKKKVKTSAPRSSKNLYRETSDLDGERRRVKQEHYLQVYNNVHRLRDLYYEHYMHALRRKITRQKEEIRRKDEELLNKMRQKEELERGEGASMKRKMSRHDFKHDDEYLKKVPKTNFYKIVQLVDHMKRTGQLKTPSEMDAFWENIKKPEVFRHYFPPTPSVDSGGDTGFLSGTNVGNLTALAQVTHHGRRPMTQIKESQESRPTTQDSSAAPWAVTHQATHVHMQAPSPAKPADPADIAKQAALDLERRLGTKPLPKLHCFTMNLAGDKPDPDVILKHLEAKKREKERRIHVGKLRHMYELALSNKATSKRILEKHDDFVNPLDNNTVKDLTSNLDLMLVYNPDEEAEKDPRPWTKHLRHAIVPIEELPEKSVSSSTANSAVMPASKRSSGKAKRMLETMKALPAPPPPPPALTLESVMGNTNTMEAKCLSSYWTNYPGPGQSDVGSTIVE